MARCQRQQSKLWVGLFCVEVRRYSCFLTPNTYTSLQYVYPQSACVLLPPDRQACPACVRCGMRAMPVALLLVA